MTQQNVDQTADSTEQSDTGAEKPATPLQTAIGVVFLIVCLVVCGNVFGLFGRGDAIRGIGASREKIASTFTPVGFAFRSVANHRGMACEEASSSDGVSVIRLVGPRDDLAYASIAVNLDAQKSDEQRQVHSVFVVALVHAAVPEWKGDEIATWLTKCMAEVKPFGAQQVEKVTDRARVKFTVTPNPVTMTVSVESKDW